MFNTVARNREINTSTKKQIQTVTIAWRNAAGITGSNAIVIAASWCDALDALNDSSWTVGNWHNLQEISLPSIKNTLPISTDNADITVTMCDWSGSRPTYITTQIKGVTRATIASEITTKMQQLYGYHQLPYKDYGIIDVMLMIKEV